MKPLGEVMSEGSVSLLERGAQMGADYLVEAGESGGRRINLKQNKEIKVYGLHC